MKWEDEWLIQDFLFARFEPPYRKNVSGRNREQRNSDLRWAVLGKEDAQIFVPLPRFSKRTMGQGGLIPARPVKLSSRYSVRRGRRSSGEQGEGTQRDQWRGDRVAFSAHTVFCRVVVWCSGWFCLSPRILPCDCPQPPIHPPRSS